MDDAVFSCRRCRTVLFSCQQVRNCHGDEIFKNNLLTDAVNPEACKNLTDDIWYVGEEDLSSWMKESVSKVRILTVSWTLELHGFLYLDLIVFDLQADWVKGKLHCPKCASRVGSFNFVSGMQCSCGNSVIPPVHIVKSKVDESQKPSLNIVNHAEDIQSGPSWSSPHHYRTTRIAWKTDMLIPQITIEDLLPSRAASPSHTETTEIMTSFTSAAFVMKDSSM